MSAQLLLFAVVVSASSAVAAAPAAAPVDKDKIQGKWKLVSRQDNGRDWPEDEVKSFKLAIVGDKVQIDWRVGKDDIQMKGSFTLDPAVTPKHLTVKWEDGGEYKGLYELSGDDLKLCVTVESGHPAPTEFTGKAGSKAALMEFHRAETDKDRLQGVWSVVSAEKAGTPLPEADILKDKPEMAFNGNKVEFRSRGKKDDEIEFKIDTEKKIKEIEFAHGLGVMKGLYAFDGETLKICFGRPGGDRPTELATKAGSDFVLMVFKKQPAPEKKPVEKK